MTTVSVLTAGSGESYRIERVYLDGAQAYGFAQDYNGIAPVEPVQVEEWLDRCPAGRLRRPVLACGVVGAHAGRQASRALRHTDEGERFDDCCQKLYVLRHEQHVLTSDAFANHRIRHATPVQRDDVIGFHPTTSQHAE